MMQYREFGADNSSLLLGNDPGAYGRISFLEGKSCTGRHPAARGIVEGSGKALFSKRASPVNAYRKWS